jgi:hypothetical protein
LEKKEKKKTISFRENAILHEDIVTFRTQK